MVKYTKIPHSTLSACVFTRVASLLENYQSQSIKCYEPLEFPS
jgi:hypothetical protein